MERLKADVQRLADRSVIVTGTKYLTVAGWKWSSEEHRPVPCFEYHDTPAEAVKAVRVDAGLEPRTKENPHAGS